MELYDAVSPLDFRYYGGDSNAFRRLRPYLSEAANIRYAARVEAAAVKVMARYGLCSQQIADDVARACEEVTATEVYEEERRNRHQVRALVNCIRRRLNLPESLPYVHLFATSADILDTANAMRLRDVMFAVVIPDAIALELLLIKLARDHADLAQIGRTHGKHAEPTTFGYALALYVSRLGGRIDLMKTAAENLRGKFSGAVGAHSAISLARPSDPAGFEDDVLAELGLRPSETNTSSQVVEPEFVTDLAYAVVSALGVLANLADDIRHLHRTEIGEVQESYARDDVGSSTMPHKVNPRNFENVKSMWKAFSPRLLTVLMDQISEHQRDLTNSASGRFTPELVAAFDICAVRMTSALGAIKVDECRVTANLELSSDRTLAEPLYILLALKGHPDAYGAARRLVEISERSGRGLRDLIWEDQDVAPYLSGLSDRERAVLHNPSLYTGAATDRTLATCEHWEVRMDSIRKLVEANVPHGVVPCEFVIADQPLPDSP